ncbi:MAG TPA: glycine cleavage system protein GcvH [Coxiellaceae bacterium]|nr:glycine cleavage system protein GcvH [Coxiellaceae bacterium]
MSQCPTQLRYTETHEWVREDEKDVVIVGITDHAQSQLGELVFVELPEVGTVVEVGDEVGVIESVKTASDIYSPVSGKIIEINENLTEQPDLMNSEPYESGWIFRVRLSNSEELEELLDAETYAQNVREDD